jgi:hypothetical protein
VTAAMREIGGALRPPHHVGSRGEETLKELLPATDARDTAWTEGRDDFANLSALTSWTEGRARVLRPGGCGMGGAAGRALSWWTHVLGWRRGHVDGDAPRVSYGERDERQHAGGREGEPALRSVAQDDSARLRRTSARVYAAPTRLITAPARERLPRCANRQGSG